MFIDTAWAEIDLKALRHNAGVVRRLAPRSRILAMLKADAYGHGLLDCARALHEVTDALAVARLDEAEMLRQVYPHSPLVLTAASLDEEALRWCAERQVAIVLHEPSVLSLLLALDQLPPVWLKLNTGMNRLGFSAPAFVAAAQALRERGVEPVAMSHFSSADEADPAPSRAQIAAFDAVVPDGLPQSLCNSAGLIAFPEAQRDWVRPGIMLYGANPLVDGPGPDLEPVMRLQARVLAVNPVGPGDAVGYGRTWRARGGGRIATLGMGYGDGYPRLPGDGARVWIKGRLHPLAGRVSMDLLAVDIGDRRDIAVGDVATLWGPEWPVEQAAAAAGTISYELLCRVQRRVSRICREA